MRFSRFTRFILAYLLLVLFAYVLVVRDVYGLRGHATAVDARSVGGHGWFLGVLGLPLSALAPAWVFLMRKAGVVAGMNALGFVVGGVVLSPLLNLFALGFFWTRRRAAMKRQGVSPAPGDDTRA